MISREEKIICPWCAQVSTLGEWNDATFAKCKNRDMRRDFTELTNEKAFDRKSDTFYLCIKCNNWARGSTLRFETNNQALKKLGGDSVYVSKGKVNNHK